MNKREKYEALIEDGILDRDLLFMDGFDNAILGVGERCGQVPVMVYSYDLIVDKLINDGMSYDEAREYIDFNITGAWMGERTPIILTFENVDEHI